ASVILRQACSASGSLPCCSRACAAEEVGVCALGLALAQKNSKQRQANFRRLMGENIEWGMASVSRELTVTPLMDMRRGRLTRFDFAALSQTFEPAACGGGLRAVGVVLEEVAQDACG